ncbi:MAG: DUF1840 domain-containing protein [Burkholderiaceae bacterium]
MIYEFKSRATGNLVMTQDVAERLLGIVGKSPGPTGIITAEQIPGAIEALERAVAREKTGGPASVGTPRTPVAAADEDRDDEPPIGLAQRAFPLIEMLKRAGAAGKDITWGI